MHKNVGDKMFIDAQVCDTLRGYKFIDLWFINFETFWNVIPFWNWISFWNASAQKRYVNL